MVTLYDQLVEMDRKTDYTSNVVKFREFFGLKYFVKNWKKIHNVLRNKISQVLNL